MPANINKTSRSYNKYDQGGYEEAVMMGDPPAKEYNTYMMQVTWEFEGWWIRTWYCAIAGRPTSERARSLCPGDISYINKYDQSNSVDVVQPRLDYSPLYPSGSPLANGVFVRPGCGKDDKTIAENDYGWGGDYFHKTIIFSHTSTPLLLGIICLCHHCWHRGTMDYYRSQRRKQTWSRNLK